MRFARRLRPHRSFPKAGALLSVLLLAVLASGCNAYPQNIFEPKSDFAIELDGLFWVILWGAIITFVVVESALLYAALRYRARPGDPLPPQIHGNTTLEIAWTAAPAVVLAIILVYSTATIFKTQAPAPAGSMLVKVIGHQYWWEFEYPELGVITANEIHMPIDKTVNLEMRSADVIHSFWIPSLGGKRDVIPGDNRPANYLWWTPNTVGVYPGQCAELCGYSHANMRMRGVVDTQADFDAWVAHQKQPAVTPAAGSVEEKGAQLFQQKGCAGCHTISGTAAASNTGPNLTHFGSRMTVAAGIMESTPENVKAWLKDPTAVKPGSLMPNLGLNDEELNALTSYLLSLK